MEADPALESNLDLHSTQNNGASIPKAKGLWAMLMGTLKVQEITSPPNEPVCIY